MSVVVAHELVGESRESFWARWAREDPASSTVGAGIVGGIAQCSLSLMVCLVLCAYFQRGERFSRRIIVRSEGNGVVGRKSTGAVGASGRLEV